MKKLVVIQEGFTFALSKLKNKQSKPYGITDKPEHMTNATMNASEITTLEQFAEYINAHDDWNDTMWEIMERNGWDETDDDNDICQSDTELLTLSDTGHAHVVPRHGCYHIFISRHNSEDVPVADVDSIEEAKEWIASETEGLVKVDDEHNCSDDVFYSAKVCHYEVFVGDMVKFVDGEEEPNINEVYQSEYYYNND